MWRKVIASLVFILTLLLLTSSIVKVHSLSTVIQNYEVSVYAPIHYYYKVVALYEAARYRIYISLETEPDGTWRPNKSYQAIVKIVRDWYNFSLCPNGVSLIIRVPMWAKGPVIQTVDGKEYIYYYNKTLIDSVDFVYNFTCNHVEEAVDIEINLEMFYYAYNTTIFEEIGEDEYLMAIGMRYLPSFWITLMEDPQQQLQTDFLRLQTQITSLEMELTNIRNLMCLLVSTTIILTVITGYLAVEKRKMQCRK